MVLRHTSTGESDDHQDLDENLDDAGYGFFIPVFSVRSGMAPNVQSIAENPARLLVFFALLLVACAEIGLDSGVLLPENAAAPVGPGVLPVAIFPFVPPATPAIPPRSAISAHTRI